MHVGTHADIFEEGNSIVSDSVRMNLDVLDVLCDKLRTELEARRFVVSSSGEQYFDLQQEVG